MEERSTSAELRVEHISELRRTKIGKLIMIQALHKGKTERFSTTGRSWSQP